MTAIEEHLIAGLDVVANDIRRFSVDEYHELSRLGILKADDRVELLEGVLVRKMTHNPPHEFVIQRLDDLLSDLLPKGWRRKFQSPITLADSEPEPDVCVFRGDLASFRDRHPTPSEIGLVIEVADTSVARDRHLKSRIYGHAGIPINWMINLPARRIEVFSHPLQASDGPGYAQTQNFAESDTIPLTLDDLVVAQLAVADLLP